MTIEKATYENLQAFNIFDPNKECRYSLVRAWDAKKPKTAIILFNPKHLNPHPFLLGQSLSRCSKEVIDGGEYGSIEVVNLFAKTSNSQDELDKKYQVFDETNFRFIKDAVDSSGMVILAWGGKGASVCRDKQFINLLIGYRRKLKCYGILGNKLPKYPRNLAVEDKLKDCYMDARGNIYFRK